MVKKIKRFIIFCLFSFFFSLLSGRIEKGNDKAKNESSWNSAEAGKCCDSKTTKSFCGGDCCSKDACCDGNCCDKCNEAGDACY